MQTEKLRYHYRIRLPSSFKESIAYCASYHELSLNKWIMKAINNQVMKDLKEINSEENKNQ